MMLRASDSFRASERGSDASMKLRKQEQGGSGSNTFVVLVVLFGAIGGILFGLDQANFSGAMVKDDFVQNFCYDTYGTEFLGGVATCDIKHCGSDSNPDCTQPAGYVSFIAWGASIIPLGAVFGALIIAPFITRSYGRRFALSFGSLFVSAAMLFCALSTNSAMFLTARALTGIGIGCVTYTLPMYNAEIAPANIRGALGVTMQLACVIGSQIATAYNIPHTTSWKISIAAPIVPALIVGIGIWFMPESPRYVMQKKGSEAAREVLIRVRRTTAVDNEMMYLQEALKQEEEEQPWSTLWTDPSIRKRVIIANLLQWFQQFTGINAMVGFGPTVFISLGLALDANVANFIANGFNLIGTFVMMGVIDRVGRRPLLISGAIVMLFTMGTAGVVQLAWKVEDGSKSPTKATFQFVLLCIYFLGFAVAWGGCPWVIPSEIFPMDVKEKALATSVGSQWLASFVIAQIVPHMISGWGIGWTFIFFGVFLVGAIIFVYLMVPETKGVELEDMDRLFGERKYNSKTMPITPVLPLASP